MRVQTGAARLIDRVCAGHDAAKPLPGIRLVPADTGGMRFHFVASGSTPIAPAIGVRVNTRPASSVGITSKSSKRLRTGIIAFHTHLPGRQQVIRRRREASPSSSRCRRRRPERKPHQVSAFRRATTRVRGNKPSSAHCSVPPPRPRIGAIRSITSSCIGVSTIPGKMALTLIRCRQGYVLGD